MPIPPALQSDFWVLRLAQQRLAAQARATDPPVPSLEPHKGQASQPLSLTVDCATAPAPPPRLTVDTAFHLAMGMPQSLLHVLLRRRYAGKTLVVVRGFLANLYRRTGNDYLDVHMQVARALGMDVLVGDVSGCRLSSSNAATLALQIVAKTRPERKVILLAHSHGALAGLEVLTNPLYHQAAARIEAFVALNGVFHGSPIADMWLRVPLLRFLTFSVVEPLMVWAGGECGMYQDMSTQTRRHYHAAHAARLGALPRRTQVLCLSSHFDTPMHAKDWWGFCMQPYRLFMQRWGDASDGCVPLLSQRLDGAKNVCLAGAHHGATVSRCGGAVDLARLMRALLALL